MRASERPLFEHTRLKEMARCAEEATGSAHMQEDIHVQSHAVFGCAPGNRGGA
jgi:hypothetical protein